MCRQKLNRMYEHTKIHKSLSVIPHQFTRLSRPWGYCGHVDQRGYLAQWVWSSGLRQLVLWLLHLYIV